MHTNTKVCPHKRRIYVRALASTVGVALFFRVVCGGYNIVIVAGVCGPISVQNTREKHKPLYWGLSRRVPRRVLEIAAVNVLPNKSQQPRCWRI